jgi:hypothetical protein
MQLNSKYRSPSSNQRWCALSLLLGISLLSPLQAALAAAPNIAGTWLPVEALSTPWPAELPLTPAAQTRLTTFEPDRHEPTSYCMPLGTPRNTLAGASPLEVLQTADRVYFVFQPNLLNVETRRVYLDGRPFPNAEELPPTWLGSSRGRWETNRLIVETRSLEPQAILNADGLTHSGKLVMRERWYLDRDREHGKLLVNDITLEDAESFTQPIHLRRVFAWAPDAQFAEGQCSERLWVDQIWRARLAEHAAHAKSASTKAASVEAAISTEATK